jgi:hypothetical protein
LKRHGLGGAVWQDTGILTAAPIGLAIEINIEPLPTSGRSEKPLSEHIREKPGDALFIWYSH